MRRWWMTWAVVLPLWAAGSGNLLAQDSDAKPAAVAQDATPAESGDKEESIASAQEGLAMRYQRFENTMLQVAEYLRKTDPERADLLVRAIGKSKETRLPDQFTHLINLLKQEQLGDALDEQQHVVGLLQGLLDLLQSEDRKNEIEKEKQRIKDLIKEVDRLRDKQTDLRSDTERKENEKALAKRQAKLAEEAQKLVNKIDGQDAAKAAAKASKDGKPGDQQKGKDGEEKDSDKDGDSKDGEPKDGEPKDGAENKDGEQKDGEKKLDDKDGDSKSGDGQKSKDGQKGKGDEKKKDGNKKDGDKQDGEKKDGDEPKDGDMPKDGEPSDSNGQPSDPKDSQKGKPQKGKPGKPQQGKPGEQKQSPEGDDQKQDSQDQQESDSPSQQPKTPGRDEIQRAKEEMERAIEELKKKNLGKASDDQDKALAELTKAKEKLEEILRQLREEERDLFLAALEARFRDMLARQLVIYNGTVGLHAVPEGQRTDRHRNRSVELARGEEAIALLAAKALTLLREEGSSIAFPEAVEQMRDDMLTVVGRMERFDVSELTQAIEKDIIESLEELIEALQKEMEKSKDKKQNPPPPQEGQQQDPALIDQLAELKTLRALQYRVNRRTKILGREVEGEQAVETDVVKQLREQARRQEKIQKATYDLSTGRNK